MFDFNSLKKTIASLSSSIADKQTQLVRLKKDRFDLAAAPGTRADVLALLHQQIDDDANSYAEKLKTSIAKTAKYGVEWEIGPTGGPLPVSIATARTQLMNAPTPRDVEVSLCFLMRKQMKEAVSQAVDLMDWPAGAQPLKGRVDKLATLDSQIAELESEMSGLREDAAKAGILV